MFPLAPSFRKPVNASLEFNLTEAFLLFEILKLKTEGQAM